MRPGTIVQNQFGREGVVVPAWKGYRLPYGDLPVVFDGTDFVVGVPPAVGLTEIGVYDPTGASLERCGFGAGVCECKWLRVVDDRGSVVCMRFGTERSKLLEGDQMFVKGSPQELFPRCQDEIQAGIAVGVPAGPRELKCK